MKLNSDYWNVENSYEWRKRVLKQITVLGVFGMVNFIYYAVYKTYIMAILNILPLIIYILATKSHQEWDYNKRKELKKDRWVASNDTRKDIKTTDKTINK